jgi:hypothetical protein
VLAGELELDVGEPHLLTSLPAGPDALLRARASRSLDIERLFV